jgi:hypothetical protein
MELNYDFSDCSELTEINLFVSPVCSSTTAVRIDLGRKLGGFPSKKFLASLESAIKIRMLFAARFWKCVIG